jgi:hypothetical protein
MWVGARLGWERYGSCSSASRCQPGLAGVSSDPPDRVIARGDDADCHCANCFYSHSDYADRDDAHRDEAHRDDAHRDDAHRDDAHRDDAHRDEAHRDDAHRDDAAHHFNTSRQDSDGIYAVCECPADIRGGTDNNSVRVGVNEARSNKSAAGEGCFDGGRECGNGRTVEQERFLFTRNWSRKRRDTHGLGVGVKHPISLLASGEW